MNKFVSTTLNDIRQLIEYLRNGPPVFIQTHNFPDHDAVGSAFGLQQLFGNFGISAQLIYDMNIQRDSLKRVIQDLEIDIHSANDCCVKPEDRIILVDGCKGNKNVTDLIGDEVGVIDHHQVKSPEEVEYVDIRVEYGACATIIASYYFELDVAMSQKVATALMIGISMDCAQLTRGVSEPDLEAYFRCYGSADVVYVNSILRNNIEIDDLSNYRYLLNHLEYQGRVGFCFFENGCSQNLLGILSDFVLALNKIDFVVLCARNQDRICFSLRSEVPEWDAAVIVRKILEGIGFGGGHADMAGGVIFDRRQFDVDRIVAHIKRELATESSG